MVCAYFWFGFALLVLSIVTFCLQRLPSVERLQARDGARVQGTSHRLVFDRWHFNNLFIDFILISKLHVLIFLLCLRKVKNREFQT